MKRKIKTLTASILCMCMFIMSGCGSSGNGGLAGYKFKDLNGTEASTERFATTEVFSPKPTGSTIQTIVIENDYYSVTVPYGWTWETWGTGSGFCFRCTNPEDPSMVIFYAGQLYPLFTSEQQKQPYYSLGQPLYTDAPVFADATVSSIFSNWDNIVNYQIKYQGFSLFPVMTNIVDKGCQVTNDFYHQFNANITDSIGYVYANSENGTPVIACSKASIGGDPMDLFGVGYDNSPKSILSMYFVECPEDKSDNFQILMDCVQSLKFTDKAIQEAQG